VTNDNNDSADCFLQARGLFKNYGSIQAVKDVSFQVFKGDVVAFLGPNGAGKSTTIKMLAGYLQPSQGEVLFSESTDCERSSVCKNEDWLHARKHTLLW
jgi:ABC-type multidrug transport system ATPase subunit